MLHDLHRYCAMVLHAVLLCMPPGALADQAAPCNPPVRLDVDDAALSETLVRLAEAYDFALVFPDSVERHVTLHDELALDALLERLTAGISTSWIHAEEADCSGHRIVKLVVYPVGEQGKVIRGAGGAIGNAKVPLIDRDYIYVDDMDSYARDVMLKKHGAELNRLTPEQRIEFRMSKRRLRQEMKAQGKDGELRRAQRAAKKAATSDTRTGGNQTSGKPANSGG